MIGMNQYIFYCQEMVFSLLHHTGLMLILQEVEIFTTVRPLILISLIELPVK